MPLFFFISGYLLRYTGERKEIKLKDTPWFGKNGFITKKTVRLLVPYVVLSTIVFVPKTMMSAIVLRPVDLSADSFFNMLVYPHDNVISYLWFLPTLFIIFCIAFAAAKTDIKSSDAVLIAVLAIISIYAPDIKLMCLGNALANTLFFACGYMFRRHRIENITGKRAASIAAVTFVISVVLTYSDIHYTVKALNGILMCVALGQLYVKMGFRFLSHLDGAAYTIYLLSWFPQVASQQILISLVPDITWHITAPLAFFTGLYMPLIVYRIVKKHIDKPYVRQAACVIGM